MIRSGWAAASRAGCAGGVLRLVVTRPVDESTRWSCASGRACSSPWRAGRPGGLSGVADPPATAVRAAASSEEIVAAPLGGPRGSVAGRLGRRWWCRGDPAPGRGRARKAVFLSRALSRARRRPGVLAGPGRTGGRRPGPVGRPPRRGRCRLGRPAAATPLRSLVGDEPHGWRGPGWTTRAGDHGVGPGPPRAASGRQAGPSHSPARFALKRGRPLYDQPRPGRAPVGQIGAHAGPEGGPLPAPGGPDPQGHVLGRRPCPAPTAMRVRASPAPGGRGRTIGADRARGGSPGGRPPGGRRRHSMTAPAHRVGDLGDRPPAQDPRRWWTPSGGGSRALINPRRTGR